MHIVGQHLKLSGLLFLRYGAVLSALWAGGVLLNQILLRIAVEIGIHSRLLGLVAIAPVVLLQLMIFVAFFVILQGGASPLPGLTRRPVPAGPAATPAQDRPGPAFAMALLAVLVPFYGYYAGWGLLGDTLRSYSQIFYQTQMRRVDFTQPELPLVALEIGQTFWVVLAVLVIWVIRRLAKLRSANRPGGWSAMVVVACEATWALLGLYVLAGWKSGLADWLASLPRPAELLDRIIPAAAAAVSDAAIRPVDWAPQLPPWEMAKSLFWYALLPLIWFNLGAIVYGHDMNSLRDESRRVTTVALDRWQALPKPVTDFIGHFWSGFVKRWHAVLNGVFLAASAGVALTVSVLVLWRLVDWAGNWGWIGIARLIGPQDMLVWQVISVPLNALFNAPGAPAGGLLVSPLQFCILAAGLELAGRAQRDATPVKPAGAEPA